MKTKDALMSIMERIEKKHPNMTPETRAEVMAQIIAEAKNLMEKQDKA